MGFWSKSESATVGQAVERLQSKGKPKEKPPTVYRGAPDMRGGLLNRKVKVVEIGTPAKKGKKGSWDSIGSARTKDTAMGFEAIGQPRKVKDKKRGW